MSTDGESNEQLADDQALAQLEVEIEQLRVFIRAAQAEQKKLEARLQPLRERLAATARRS